MVCLSNLNHLYIIIALDRWQKGKQLLLASLSCWIIFTLPLGFIQPPATSCMIYKNYTSYLYIPDSGREIVKRSAIFDENKIRETRNFTHYLKLRNNILLRKIHYKINKEVNFFTDEHTTNDHISNGSLQPTKIDNPDQNKTKYKTILQDSSRIEHNDWTNWNRAANIYSSTKLPTVSLTLFFQALVYLRVPKRNCSRCTSPISGNLRHVRFIAN